MKELHLSHSSPPRWSLVIAASVVMCLGPALSAQDGPQEQTNSVKAASAEDGVFVRFRLLKPEGAKYYVNLGGYIHQPNWYLPSTATPAGADTAEHRRLEAGKFTQWFNLKEYAGPQLHRRKNLAGGIAEFPNITAAFIVDPPSPRREVEIELATAPDPSTTVKRWHEEFEGSLTSFLVSPDLAADASQLESAREMTERRLRWAREATGGTRRAPKRLLLQTSFAGLQREELNLKEAEVLSLLGFNVVGNMPQEVRAGFPEFRTPDASHDVLLGPQSDRQAVRERWEALAPVFPKDLQPGAPCNFQDEICAPAIGSEKIALQAFRDWLKSQEIAPAELGVDSCEGVIPIETPEMLRDRMKVNEAAARRVFYYTCRFRQLALTDRLIWNSQELHERFGPEYLSSTLLADHPYFSGTGLGMGMDQQNNTWEGWPLAADWFDIGRRGAVDIIGIEDWMGLQFMYGPQYTWEGFQLMGFQATIFRSASRGQIPIIAWITPSDERNLRLKAASALCQGAKNFYYWTYGPTATSTENYWSDQPGSYPGMARLSRMLEFAEQVVHPGKTRPTRVALLYSVASDLWQPLGYAQMLERRGIYLALTHEQYLVDMLTEEEVAAGRLDEYRILYTADPCISDNTSASIKQWVKQGGTLVATCAAGSRNEFGEPSVGLSEVFGISPEVTASVQTGDYRTRGMLNNVPHLDRVKFPDVEFGVIGVKTALQPRGAAIKATFTSDGAPALLENRLGKGRSLYFATTPGISYIKDAKFVADALAEKWPMQQRHVLTQFAREAQATPLLGLSEPVVEVGIYDTPERTALILANFTYERIDELQIEVPTPQAATSVNSLTHGALPFEILPAPSPWKEEGYHYLQRFTIPLGDDDIVILETR